MPAVRQCRRIREVAALADLGYSRKQISAVLTLRPDAVSALMTKARREGFTAVKWREVRTRTGNEFRSLPERDFYKMSIRLDRETAQTLYDAATKRRMSLTALVQLLIATAVDDDMVGNILDDGQ